MIVAIDPGWSGGVATGSQSRGRGRGMNDRCPTCGQRQHTLDTRGHRTCYHCGKGQWVKIHDLLSGRMVLCVDCFCVLYHVEPRTPVLSA